MPATLGSRSSFVNATYTAIALVFFFGVGLAGGAAYKLWPSDDVPDQVADEAAPPPAAGPAAPASVAQATSDPTPSLAAPPLAQVTPAAPPSVPPAPVADAAPSPAPPTPAPQVAPDAAPVLDAAVARPAPVVAAAPPAVAHPRAAVPPKKPRLAAKTAHPAPRTVALHAPPAAPANLAGPYRVQFGAFANEDNARRVQWAVEATGMKVDVTQAPGAGGHALFYLRSPTYHDYAAALSAAQSVQDRVEHFVNAIPIEYAILGDHSPVEQQAEVR